MANGTVYFRVVAKDINTGKTQEMISAGTGNACFASMSLRRMAHNLRVHQFEWHYEVNLGEHAGNGSTEEELRQMVEILFPVDQRYGMEIEFINESQHEGRKVVRFTNMGSYPRNLFMGKLFVIRNHNRYPESYKFFKKLLSVGVPFRYAMVIGATIHQQSAGLRGWSTIYRGYARTMNPYIHTVADLRNSADGKALGNIGAPWGSTDVKDFGGYNVHRYDGIESSTHRTGYTNSKTLNAVTSSKNGMTIDWEGVMKLVSALTGSKHWLKVTEPYVGYTVR